MKRCVRKDHQVFLIHLSEVENEIKVNEFNKGEKVFLGEFRVV